MPLVTVINVLKDTNMQILSPGTTKTNTFINGPLGFRQEHNLCKWNKKKANWPTHYNQGDHVIYHPNWNAFENVVGHY